jgi:hypothetical protein
VPSALNEGCGDAKLSGAIDGSDYSLIDFAYANNETHPVFSSKMGFLRQC